MKLNIDNLKRLVAKRDNRELAIMIQVISEEYKKRGMIYTSDVLRNAIRSAGWVA